MLRQARTGTAKTFRCSKEKIFVKISDWPLEGMRTVRSSLNDSFWSTSYRYVLDLCSAIGTTNNSNFKPCQPGHIARQETKQDRRTLNDYDQLIKITYPSPILAKST